MVQNERAHQDAPQGHRPRPHKAVRRPAHRKKGHAFSPDSYMQHELEASFIYEDTPDQLSATAAVKADMESERPMDRLVCGDVGFRQNGNRHPRRLQGRRRQQAGGRAGAYNRAGLPTLQHIQETPGRLSGACGVSFARTQPQGHQSHRRRPRSRQNRHNNRHPQAHRQNRKVQGPGAAYRGRGTEIRRCRERKAQAAENQRRHPYDDSHAHPAHSPVLAHGSPRPLHHSHSSAQPLPDYHQCRRAVRRSLWPRP